MAKKINSNIAYKEAKKEAARLQEEELEQARRDSWISTIEEYRHDIPTSSLGWEYRSFYYCGNHNPYEDYDKV